MLLLPLDTHIIPQLRHAKSLFSTHTHSECVSRQFAVLTGVGTVWKCVTLHHLVPLVASFAFLIVYLSSTQTSFFWKKMFNHLFFELYFRRTANVKHPGFFIVSEWFHGWLVLKCVALVTPAGGKKDEFYLLSWSLSSPVSLFHLIF